MLQVLRSSRFILILFLLISQRPGASLALDLAGSNTDGGARAGAVVIHVTTLADTGPGSLRDALTNSAPRVIVFDVSGYITLKQDLIIARPSVTVAGQTS